MSKKGKKDKNNKNKQESKGSFTGRKILKLGFWSGLAAAIVSAPLVLYNPIVRELEYNPKVISVEEARDSIFRDRLKIRPSATDISKLEGVEKIVGQHGEYPDIILIPQDHPVDVSVKQTVYEREFNIEKIEKILDQLYKKHGVRSLILEGLDSKTTDKYASGVELSLRRPESTARSDSDKVYTTTLERILRENRWTLYPGDSEEIFNKLDNAEGEITALRDSYLLNLDAMARKASEKANQLASKGSLDDLAKTGIIGELKGELDELYVRYKDKLNKTLTPEKLDEIYSIKYTERQKFVAEQVKQIIKEDKGPVCIVYGYGHAEQTLDGLSQFNRLAILTRSLDSNLKLNMSKEDLREYYLTKPNVHFMEQEIR